MPLCTPPLYPSPNTNRQVVLSLLPRVWVGTYDRLHRLVEWLAGEMRGSFRAGDGGLPPWRSLAAMLNKWRLVAEEGGEEEAAEGQQPPAQAAAAAGWGSAGGASAALASAATAAAFTAQQQESMRALLQHPAATAALPAGGLAQALTASSSCSSMDVVGSGVGAGPNASASGGVSTPRSMLTQELAAAGAKRQHAQQQGPPPQRQHLPPQDAVQAPQEGPAAAILSLLGRSQLRSV